MSTKMKCTQMFNVLLNAISGVQSRKWSDMAVLHDNAPGGTANAYKSVFNVQLQCYLMHY